MKTEETITYIIRYHAGTYEGTREVQAYDEEQAIAKVRAWVRKSMTLSMYSDSYKIIGAK